MSRLLSFGVAACALSVGLLAAMPARAEKCVPIKPKVTITLKDPKVELNHALTVTELNRHFNNTSKAGRGLNTWHANSSVIRGVTSGVPDLYYTFYPGFWKSGSQYCYGIKEIKLNFGLKSHVVYIPRIYARHSCEYKVVSAHEQQHVNINRKGFASYATKAKTFLVKELSRTGSAVVTSQKAGEAAMNKAIQKAVLAVYVSMLAETSRQHGVLDSPQNYQRENAKCAKWVRDVR